MFRRGELAVAGQILMVIIPATLPQRAHGFKSRILALIGRRGIDQVGPRTELDGALHIVNDGFIQIGADCRVSSHPVRSHLLTLPGASIIIGDRVRISYGAGFSSVRSIEIGDDTEIGPFCIILDNDFHKVGDRNAAANADPIVIGRGVLIGARVTVLRGARIGDGASIESGSTVFGVIASNAVVAGVPAKPAAKPFRDITGRS